MTVSEVALLTGGGDRPYALGLAGSLIAEGVAFDFIGSDELQSPDLDARPLVRVLNLRGATPDNVPWQSKVSRIVSYYWRLLRYAATADAPVFHILWNNKIAIFDRTVLTLYYRWCGRRLVLTVHNVNIGKRDGKDSWVNQLTLWAQYHLVDHLFVHTTQMGQELQQEFGVPADRITVIPFGINSTVPDTALSGRAARRQIGLDDSDRVLLFFGNIAPYKGLEYLVEALAIAGADDSRYRLVVAGRLKCSTEYWEGIQEQISRLDLDAQIVQRIEFVPDDETELYFKAADVLVLPYTYVFQSGVLFLGYNFGLPVIASDVASLKDDIQEGTTGFVCQPRDPQSLAGAIADYFSSDLYRSLSTRRPEIQKLARERYSWARVGRTTKSVYQAVANR